jgi:hypothetical protein
MDLVTWGLHIITFASLKSLEKIAFVNCIVPPVLNGSHVHAHAYALSLQTDGVSCVALRVSGLSESPGARNISDGSRDPELHRILRG